MLYRLQGSRTVPDLVIQLRRRDALKIPATGAVVQNAANPNYSSLTDDDFLEF